MTGSTGRQSTLGPAAITGAAAGLGEALARHFARQRRNVAIMDVDAAGLERVAADVRREAVECLSVVGDVGDHLAVQSFAAAISQHFGALQILVNNAAIATDESLLDTTEESWDYQVRSTLTSAFFCTKAFAPHLTHTKGAAICNIGSVNALSHLGNEAYSAAKAGLIALTKSSAVELAPLGIRVNMVMPGTIRTPSWSRRESADPEIFERLRKWYPLGRVGEVEDIAEAVEFLCSSRASWITGAVLVVDGGLTAGNKVMTDELLGRTNR